MRRDVSRLAAALAERQALSAAALLAYWSVARGQLHRHVLEDTVVCPCLTSA